MAKIKPEPEPTLEEVEARLAGLLVDLESEDDEQQRAALQDEVAKLDEQDMHLRIEAERAVRRAELVAKERAKRERLAAIEAEEAERHAAHDVSVAATEERAALCPEIEAALDVACDLIVKYAATGERQWASDKVVHGRDSAMPFRNMNSLANYVEHRMWLAFEKTNARGSFNAHIDTFSDRTGGWRPLTEVDAWATQAPQYVKGPLLEDFEAEQQVRDMLGVGADEELDLHPLDVEGEEPEEESEEEPKEAA